MSLVLKPSSRYPSKTDLEIKAFDTCLFRGFEDRSRANLLKSRLFVHYRLEYI